MSLSLLDDEEDAEDDGYPLDDYYRPSSYVEQVIAKQRIVAKSMAPLTVMQSYIIDSCLARQDFKQAESDIQDWNNERARVKPVADISKWTPGIHYYALGQKFGTLDEAIGHLKSKGIRFSGTIRERFQYRESGG